MVILYKDPKGEKIFERGQSQGTLNTSAIDDANRVSDEQFQNLEKHCVELEGRLGKYEVRNFISYSVVNLEDYLPY